MAITILVSAFSVIFPMFNQTGNQLARAEQWQRRLSLEKNIYQSLAITNPLQHTDGRGSVSGTEFTWQATPISAQVNSRNELEDNGRFMLQMFQIDVSYVLDGKQQTLSFEQLGWDEKQ